MDLVDRISDEIKLAMRNRDQNRLDALRAVRNEIIKFSKQGNLEKISDEDVVKLLKSQIKQRQDSISMFEKGGRKDLILVEEEQLVVLQEFLPEQLSGEKLEEIVAEAISKCDATSVKHMGLVMKNVKDLVGETGKDVDNRVVAELVKAKLQ